MTNSNQSVLIILIAIIVLFFTVLIIGYRTHQLAFLISLLNLVSAMTLLIYWLQKQIRITQHIFELREMVVLSLEMMVVVCAIYGIASHQNQYWLNIIHYVVFVIHIVCLILFLMFLLTFKMDRLL
jgi:peptidoglycan biosynthesis protein MviN/MurJ (putative lipid II flippase)